MDYPIRINKYLALKKICSRKEADQLIKQQKVLINGRLAVLGDKVGEIDQVKLVKNYKGKELIYIAANKPKGVVTHSPQKGEKGLAAVLNLTEKVFPIGRLDKDSYGLIILTNDGRITDRLLNPDHYHEKEYTVRVDKKITPGFIKQMAGGVILDDGYKTRSCQVMKKNDLTLRIILTEGKKRQIRRMCEKLGRQVVDLRRDRIMNIRLENLGKGKCRKIVEEELAQFLKMIGL